MTVLPGGLLAFALLAAPVAEAPPSLGVLQEIFIDGFDDESVLAWSGAVGLAEGEVCEQFTTSCIDPLLCCYPCGIPDCDHLCTDTGGGSCPILP